MLLLFFFFCYAKCGSFFDGLFLDYINLCKTADFAINKHRKNDRFLNDRRPLIVIEYIHYAFLRRL